MLPKFLVGTYQQYKQDTKAFTTWLIVTARISGYVSEAVPASKILTDPRKLKSKTKCKGKTKSKTKKQKRDAARRIPREQRKFVISPREFQPLAQHIVDNLKPPSTVPSSILSMLKRVINARKDSDDWFRKNTTEDDNDGHMHFIRILQGVYDTLQPYVSSGGGDGVEEDSRVHTIDNVFDHLHLEEPSEQFLNTPSLPRPDNKKARMVYEFVDVFMEHVQSYFEETFAASSLFRDINKICQHVQKTWIYFKEGKLDLMTAAFVSNTAVELVRRLEDEFFESFPRFRRVEHHILKNFKKYDPKHRDAQQLINFMYRAKCVQKKKEPQNDNPQDALFNLELFEDARYVFLDMLSILLTYYQGSQRMTKVVYSPGPYGLWDPDSDYSSMNATQKHNQDRRILLELLPDMLLMATSTSGIHPLAEDELLRGSRNIITEHSTSPAIHLWMLVSLRIFCDIHHVLGADISKPFDTVRRLGRDAINTVNECIAQRQKGDLQCWTEDSDELIKTTFLDRIQHFLFVDEVKTYIDYHGRNLKGWSGKKDFELFRRHPWARGLMELTIRGGMEELGLHTVNSTYYGVVAAHLYNALQKEKMLTVPWADMDTFLELMGDDQVFRGDRPSNLKEYSSRLSLFRGISAETFARNRRDRGMLQSKRGRRQLGSKSELLQIAYERLALVLLNKCTTDGEIAATLAKLEHALNDQIFLTSNETHVTVRTRDDFGTTQLNKRAARQQRRYDPIELLMSLQFGLASALPSITFDHLAFHKSCLQVLKVVQDLCAPILDATMPVEYRAMDPSWAETISFPVDFLLSLGMPMAVASKMIRKVAMPCFPPRIPEFQQTFDQEAILNEVAKVIRTKIVNGRLRIPTNLRARKSMDARPKVIDFEIQAVNLGNGHLTFKKHKMWRHSNSKCTRNGCVCGAKSTPMFKQEWKQAISEQAEKLFTKDD